MIPNVQKALELSRGPYIDETVFLSQGNMMWFAFLSDNYNNGKFTGFTGSVQPVKDTTDGEIYDNLKFTTNSASVSFEKFSKIFFSQVRDAICIS